MYPAEIERVLAGVKGIVEVAVIGVPDARWGETPAVVAFTGGEPLTGDEVLAACRGELADYKVPRYLVVRDEPLAAQHVGQGAQAPPARRVRRPAVARRTDPVTAEGAPDLDEPGRDGLGSGAPYGLDLATVDRLLTTTRSVRRRLDLDQPVALDDVRECLEIAQQAPTGSNNRSYRWIVVTDGAKRQALADIYRKGLGEYARATEELSARGFESKVGVTDDERTRALDAQTKRVFASARHLTAHLQDVPVHVIPCMVGRLPDTYDNFRAAAFYGSLHPAIWSFQLALAIEGLRQRLHHPAPGARGRGRGTARRARPHHPARPRPGGALHGRELRSRRSGPHRRDRAHRRLVGALSRVPSPTKPVSPG